VLAAYYMLKTVRESLILTDGGAAVKAYSSAGQAFLLLGLVPAFGAFASRVNRIRLVGWVTLFFVSNILLFFAAGRLGLHVAVPYFLWVGIFNVMVISQFWAFVNDLYTPDQGKRLFPIVGVGSSLGAWIGSLYAGDVIRATGPYPLMLIAAGVLVLSVVLGVPRGPQLYPEARAARTRGRSAAAAGQGRRLHAHPSAAVFDADRAHDPLPQHRQHLRRVSTCLVDSSSKHRSASTARPRRHWPHDSSSSVACTAGSSAT